MFQNYDISHESVSFDKDIAPTLEEETGETKKYHLRVIYGTPEVLQPELPLHEVQVEMLNLMQNYCLRPQVSAPLLIRIPPGVGKTHAGVQTAQDQAAAGKTVLWATQRRDALDDVRAMAHYRNDLWYEWKTVSDKNPETGFPVCRFSEQQVQWTHKGYPLRGLCDQLCNEDAQALCPFLNQRKGIKGKIVAARHQHLVMGVNLPQFDVVFIDELPLHAVVQERVIPQSGLFLKDGTPAIQELSTWLITHSISTKVRISGRDLIEPLYPLLSQLLNNYRVSKSRSHRFLNLPMATSISDLHFNWLEDALDVFEQEMKEYEAGADQWAERIWISKRGLHILKRLPLSSQLPSRCIILDATGEPLIYKRIFGVSPEIYTARVERKGRLYQYTKRTNGKSRLTSGAGGECSKDTNDLINQVRELIGFRGYQKPGIIVHLGTKDIWQKAFSNATILHFGALRGSNAMIGCDGVFVTGVNGLSPSQVVNLATGLDHERRRSFGDISRLWQHPYRRYCLSEAGLTRLRQEYDANAAGIERQIGCYADPDLDAVSRQYREGELVHAFHRARLTLVDCDVWVMSAVPTDELVDWVTETIGTIPIGMKQKYWDIIKPELDFCEQMGYPVTYQLLSQLTQVDVSNVKKRSWMEKIVRHFPDTWKIDLIPSMGGRPLKALIPIRTFVTSS